MLVLDSVTVRAGKATLLDSLSLGVAAGEVVAIVGPNGAGKTTALRVLAGETAPAEGAARFDGRPLTDVPDLARRRAVLPQESGLAFGFTALDVVLLGRTPWRASRRDDLIAAQRAMAQASVEHLAGRRYPTLSGGERQRVHLARALAQIDPGPGSGAGSASGDGAPAGRYLLLDEPTSALDLGHQHAVLQTARRVASEGAGVLAVLHDLNLAAQYADRIAVLAAGRLVAVGTPGAVLTPTVVRCAFGITVVVTAHPCAACPLVVPVPEPAPAKAGGADFAFDALPVLAQLPPPMQDLRDTFAAFRADTPKARIRTAARDLGTTEAQLVQTAVDGPAVRLGPPAGGWRALLPELEALGDVMALTRNDACVHERHGVYSGADVALPHGMALFLGADIDLRLFCARWDSAFAVETNGRRSLQFFDRHGDAVHKVFLTDASDAAAYDAFVAAHRAADQTAPIETTPAPDAKADRPDAEIDAAGLLAGWAGLQDTHDFYPLLGQFETGRVQALRLAEGRFTERVEPATVRRALEAAAADGTPIMVFVGNRGAIQIHTGPVERLVERGPWFNVLDARFNLHLDETAITDAFIVVKPSADGDVTAVEAYDAAGTQIVQLFGKRKPGIPELQAWRDLVAGLPRAGVEA